MIMQLCVLASLVLGMPLGAPVHQHDGVPVLKAGSRSVDVQDGHRLLKGVWLADPNVPLDTYKARRSTTPKRVTFVSDRDRLSLDLVPGHAQEFVILLDDGAECRTRVFALPAPVRVDGGDASQAVEIPIRIVHGKLHLSGRINQSAELDLIFDTGADTTVLYPSGVRKGARVQADSANTNTGTGGTVTLDVGQSNCLEVGALRWNDEPVMLVGEQADVADGIVGYPVFEGRVVELDYDRMIMTVMESLPTHASEFARVDMVMAGSLTAVDATLASGKRSSTGPVILDTAGTGALLLNQAFAKEHPLLSGLPVIGDSVSRGVGPGRVRNQVAMLPTLVVAGFPMHQVPIDMAVSDGPIAELPTGKLCMEVLARFNTILDYRNDHAYFKPNRSFSAPFADRTNPFGPTAIVAVVVAIAAALGVGVWLVRGNRHKKSHAPAA